MIGLAALALAVQAAPTVAAMRGDRRVLIVAAPDDRDPGLAAQRNALSGWRRGAADRDVTVVEIVGARVTGARDAAAALRRRYALPLARFGVALIGKDGHVAFRSREPVLAETLQGRIDAMPMRRAGLD